MPPRRLVRLPDGCVLPALGQGAWMMGENPGKRAGEIAALRAGIEADMKLIDTAEMYGNGRSEKLIGEAIRDIPRESLFIVSKVLPSNAGRDKLFHSFEQTLEHLGTSYLDLYLLHWRGGVPLAETVDCFQKLVKSGKLRRWGVSNFDLDDMKELWQVPHGPDCAVNQVLYHLGSRGIEYSLLPWMTEHRIPLMAYCPIAQAGELQSSLYKNAAVQGVAKRHQASTTQILLAFVLQSGNVIAIPKSSSVEHTMENAAADGIALTEEDLAALNTAFPPPSRKTHLDIV